MAHTHSDLHSGKELTYLALGDSYTKGESVPWLQNYPNQLVKALRDSGLHFAEPTVIAQTGWRSDDLKNAIHTLNPPSHDLVSLSIGVNNFYQGRSAESFAPEFEDLLLKAIQLAKNRKDRVFVLSIPDYGYTPLGQDDRVRISEGIQNFNTVCEQMSQKHGVKYFYITDITQKGLEQPGLVASDGLHPSALAYHAFVEKTAPYWAEKFSVNSLE